jgi:predicted nucleic acid-binding protein
MKIDLFPFDNEITIEAVNIQKKLLKQNALIEFEDVAIGATALHKRMKLATLNTEHFNRIEGLEIITRK